MPATASTTHAAPSRILSVDVLRGLTIALMILVNDPGDGTHTYAQLDHARWNGLTLTDLVFPTFLLLVGASIIFSLAARVARGDSRAALARNIIRRSMTIVLIDFFLALFPHFHLGQLRIFGVLTRIAVCYLVVGLLCLLTQRAAILASLAALFLLAYWVLMRFVPVPGYGLPVRDIPLLDPDRNLAAVIDRAFNGLTQQVFHTGRLYEHTRDPEGLLSTLPALSTTLIGALTGIWLRRSTPTVHRAGVTIPVQNLNRPASSQAAEAVQTQGRTLVGLVLASLVFLIIGYTWNSTFPLNKKLWTSSYVFAAAGWSLAGLSLCYLLIDYLRLERRSVVARAFLWPWLVFGSNAITAYAVSELLVEIAAAIHIHDVASSRPMNLWGWTYRHTVAIHASTVNTSLIFALCYVALCFLPNLWLWHRRIFLKV